MAAHWAFPLALTSLCFLSFSQSWFTEESSMAALAEYPECSSGGTVQSHSVLNFPSPWDLGNRFPNGWVFFGLPLEESPKAGTREHNFDATEHPSVSSPSRISNAKNPFLRLSYGCLMVWSFCCRLSKPNFYTLE